jgi:DNA-binding FadR family transcriptional regulator
VGGPITEVMSMVLAPAITRRRDTWLKELADALDQMERKFDRFRIENLKDDEPFISAVIDATRTAIGTHKGEKRAALRNALLNIALHRSTDEDQQQIFLRYIDELTVWHLRILQLFQNPPLHLASKGIKTAYFMGGSSQVLEDMYPELQGRREFYDQVVADLNSRGLLNSPNFLHSMMSAQGMVEKRTTPLADALLTFIADPLA